MFTALRFLAKQVLNGAWTATLVQVKAVHQGGGALAVAGTVDIQPMVNQIDGKGNATPHGTIYGVPYMRLQGGKNAVIIDPEVGDIGIAMFASHDISSVIATQKVANPGSRRRFDPSDALYLGGFLNAQPTTFLQFIGGSLNITAPSGKTIAITCGTATITADHVTVMSNDVNLGATGGAAVARVGDTVSGGVITSGSSKVKAA